MIDKEMTMKEAHRELIERFKDAYFDLLEIHTDTTYLNSDTSDYREKLDEFHRIQSRIFVFKNLWDEVESYHNETT